MYRINYKFNKFDGNGIIDSACIDYFTTSLEKPSLNIELEKTDDDILVKLNFAPNNYKNYYINKVYIEDVLYNEVIEDDKLEFVINDCNLEKFNLKIIISYYMASNQYYYNELYNFDILNS